MYKKRSIVKNIVMARHIIYLRIETKFFAIIVPNEHYYNIKIDQV